MLYLPIAGTRVPWRGRNADPHDWYRRESPFDRLMAHHGFMRVEQDRDPTTPDRGYWSGDVGGLLLQRAWPWTDGHAPWTQGARELIQFLCRRWTEFAGGVTLVAHSHGGQVVAYAVEALGYEQPVPVHIITVDMPVRRDMVPVYEEARRVAATWTHLYSERGWRSRFRWLGNRFGPRELDVADRNMEVSGGHSGILSDPRHMEQWPAVLARLSDDG